MSDTRQPFHFSNGRQFIEKLAARLLDEYDLFATADQLYLFEPDAKIQLTPVSINRLRELVDARLCAVRLVMRDGRYQKEQSQLNLSRTDLSDVIAELVKLAPPAPLMVKALSASEQKWAVDRLRQGEHPAAIGRSYGVPEAAIVELRKVA